MSDGNKELHTLLVEIRRGLKAILAAIDRYITNHEQDTLK